MAKLSLIDRLTGGAPKIDWELLNQNLADARAQLALAGNAREQLALAAVMGQPGGAEALAAGAHRLQEASRRVDVAEAAIAGGHAVEAAQRAAVAAREQGEADKRARADLDALVKLAEDGERLLAAYAEWFPKALEAWNAVQPHFATNPHMRPDMEAGHPLHQQVPLEIARTFPRELAVRPDMMPPGGNVHALGFAHEIEPLGKVYRTIRDNAFKKGKP